MFKLACLVGTLAAGSVEAFAPSSLRPVARPFSRTHGRVWLSPEEAEKAAKIKQIMAEEAMDPETMAMTAERMKEMSPQDLDTMIGEVASMDGLQKEQLKAMGMDPDMMQASMKMMRDNPALMQSAQKMMEKMSPEELVASSKMAQQQMSKMSPEEMESAAKTMAASEPEIVDRVMKDLDAVQSSTTMPAGAKDANDPALLDAMYRSAEYMSQPPSGGVTFRAFATLGPIAAVTGPLESDMTPPELRECWEDGAMGASRVDRAGFGRVWKEVVDLFEDDLMAEARDPNSSAARAKAMEDDDDGAVAAEPVGMGAGMGAGMPGVGQALTPEQMAEVNDKVKGMSGDEMGQMMEQMQSMGPEQEKRMREMGVDPEMMKQSLKMMKDNPMMMKAAQAMMSRMSPEQMLQASQNAQKQMAGMSEADKQKALDDLKKGL